METVLYHISTPYPDEYILGSFPNPTSASHSKSKGLFSLNLDLVKYSGAVWPSVKLISEPLFLAFNSLNL